MKILLPICTKVHIVMWYINNILYIYIVLLRDLNYYSQIGFSLQYINNNFRRCYTFIIRQCNLYYYYSLFSFNRSQECSKVLTHNWNYDIKYVHRERALIFSALVSLKVSRNTSLILSNWHLLSWPQMLGLISFKPGGVTGVTSDSHCNSGTWSTASALLPETEAMSWSDLFQKYSKQLNHQITFKLISITFFN